MCQWLLLKHNSTEYSRGNEKRSQRWKKKRGIEESSFIIILVHCSKRVLHHNPVVYVVKWWAKKFSETIPVNSTKVCIKLTSAIISCELVQVILFFFGLYCMVMPLLCILRMMRSVVALFKWTWIILHCSYCVPVWLLGVS